LDLPLLRILYRLRAGGARASDRSGGRGPATPWPEGTPVGQLGECRRLARALGVCVGFHLGLERGKSLHHGAVVVSHDGNYGMIRRNVAALDLTCAGLVGSRGFSGARLRW